MCVERMKSYLFTFASVLSIVSVMGIVRVMDTVSVFGDARIVAI